MKRRPTFWQSVAIIVALGGLWATFVRFSQGLGASTNLSDTFPWGIWIGFDVLVGVGLAAGGFTITAVVHLFHLERFRPIVRPTILTAFLGYLLVIVGLLFDLGRPYRIWHPMIMWNPHSVMFEVAWCVTLYTTVLALEFSPIVLERFKWHTPLKVVRAITVPVVITGVLLSTLHQSSLGTLYVIMPDKLYGLWYSPLLPVFFFLSAIAGGLAMVIIESGLSARVFHKRLENDLLADLSRVLVAVLALYMVIKCQDLTSRDVWSLLLLPGPERFLFVTEIVFGALVPLLLLSLPAIRRDASGRFCTAMLVMLGFVLNRLNVATTGLQRGLGSNYFPSILELAITGTLIVLGFVTFTLAVKHLPIFPEETPNDRTEALQPSPKWVHMATHSALTGLGVVMLFGLAFIDFNTSAMATQVQPEQPIKPSAEPFNLPEDIVMPNGPDSPGTVTFRHNTHINTRQPDCGPCHAGTFSMLKRTTKPIGETMHSADQCGKCHNGQDAFLWEDNCTVCHEE